MNYVKLLFVLFAGLTMSACAGAGARTDYYLAVQQAAQAQAAQTEARYRALATIAQGGDPAAKAMATMAIAMNQEQTITPAYIEDSALKWAQVLATPVATLGGLWIQSDVAKNASNNAKEIQLANFASNEAIQLGQQNMVTGLGSQWAQTAAGSADLAIAGFNALNVAGGQTVELGIAGLDTADSIANAGFTANTDIAGLGFATADSIATTGIATVGAVGVAGFTQIGLTAEDGINATGNVGLAGMNNLVTLGQSGFTALNTMSADYNTLLDNVNTTNAGTLVDLNAAWGGALADANATNLAGQTNYAQAIADMQATIDAMAADLGQTVVCADDGTGTIVCN